MRRWKNWGCVFVFFVLTLSFRPVLGKGGPFKGEKQRVGPEKCCEVVGLKEFTKLKKRVTTTLWVIVPVFFNGVFLPIPIPVESMLSFVLEEIQVMRSEGDCLPMGSLDCVTQKKRCSLSVFFKISMTGPVAFFTFKDSCVTFESSGWGYLKKKKLKLCVGDIGVFSASAEGDCRGEGRLPPTLR
jgi:hypothetical protein